ncbi:fungal-specific transcription factor domain-containing protein [Xylariomycetidae sp. FL2044]|nr:fungal-specific transcription factor domain-containing protein [Xylariomycetidae sp. FL2044]
MGDAPLTSKPTTSIGDKATVSCERCRRRKIKCDRKQPCSACESAGTQCLIAGAGEKQRPIPKSYVQALERNVASLELFIQRLATASHAKRDEMLAGYLPEASHGTGDFVSTSDNGPETPSDHELVLARARAGQLRKLRAGNAAQFFGGTSLFQIHDPEHDHKPLGSGERDLSSPGQIPALSSDQLDANFMAFGIFPYSPHDEMCQTTMANFFKFQYPYQMCLYREFFLRDYDTGAGRYYSEVLLYAICALGALAEGDPAMKSVSETFAMQAETLVYSSLDQPDLTLLQALILLGYRSIGNGKTSKGWIFCGMAFRLAHEMGLHLDPNNWNGPSEPQIDREISRRIYWAAFNADKQLSLYFGRPPALYPHEADVRNTIRIPYPEGWQSLLDTYIAKDVSVTAYEDGIALSGSFIYRVELMKIVHKMITDVFENRRHNADSTVLAATAQSIHVSLNKWLATLPGKLHWNQWINGQVQPFVLHLHMLFHTAMIILHRPPRHMFKKPGIASSEEVEFCYESLQSILKLLRSYAKYYRLSALPLDFVHTLSVAAGTVLMKRHLEGAAAGDPAIARAMDTVLDAMYEIRHTWPCVVEIRESVLRAMETRSHDTPEPIQNHLLDLGFLSGAGSEVLPMPDPGVGDSGGGGGGGSVDYNFQFSDAELAPFMSDDFLTGQVSWHG